MKSHRKDREKDESAGDGDDRRFDARATIFFDASVRVDRVFQKTIVTYAYYTLLRAVKLA